MERLRGLQALAPLRVRNYRLYFSGQIISLVGTWMQTVAQAWLVLQLTHSGTMLGAVTAVQLLPVLVLSPWGGLLADRVSKPKLMLAGQVLMGLQALTLGLLVVSGAVTLAWVFIIASVLGLTRALTLAGQQSFVSELVELPLLRQAVSLNSVSNNAARAVGPAVAGILIATSGVGVCFLVNAASFIAVIASLLLLDRSALLPAPVVERASGQIKEGFVYVRHHQELLLPLLMMAVIGTLAYEFQVVLPLMAKGPLHGGARAYGLMSSAMGVGAVIGGLAVAGRSKVGSRSLAFLALLFGVTILGAALAPNLISEIVLLLFVGATSISFISAGSSTLQLASKPQFRGRVMALWSIAFIGTTPIGGPIVGAISQYASPRAGLMLGAASCVLSAALVYLFERRQSRLVADPITAEA